MATQIPIASQLPIDIPIDTVPVPPQGFAASDPLKTAEKAFQEALQKMEVFLEGVKEEAFKFTNADSISVSFGLSATVGAQIFVHVDLTGQIGLDLTWTGRRRLRSPTTRSLAASLKARARTGGASRIGLDALRRPPENTGPGRGGPRASPPARSNAAYRLTGPAKGQDRRSRHTFRGHGRYVRRTDVPSAGAE